MRRFIIKDLYDDQGKPCALTVQGFSALMDAFYRLGAGGAIPDVVAVGVSGGPDSMALCYLLSRWAEMRGDLRVHAISVDHGLRLEAAQEVVRVAEIVRDWPCITHHALIWAHEDVPESRVQERARAARYALMGELMARINVRDLFLGHHMDDQAETFLFRLAKGSGIDGLGGMRLRQPFSLRGEGLEDGVLCRPLLDIPKACLVETCEQNSISYVCDPTNDSSSYARGRMRQSMAVLAEEGLTKERLCTTAYRFDRAQNALNDFTELSYKNIVLEKNTDQIVFKFLGLESCAEEVGVRVLIRGVYELCPPDTYGVRLSRFESLYYDLVSARPFRRRTLGGVIITRKDRDGIVVLSREMRGENVGDVG